MDSYFLNSLSKFESNHNELESVKNIIKEIKSKENHDIELSKTDFEAPEYPIENYENQQHAIERHIKKKYFF
jgi:hypothetical protein